MNTMQLWRIDTKTHSDYTQAYKAIKAKCALAANQNDTICFGWTYYMSNGEKVKLETFCKPRINLQ